MCTRKVFAKKPRQIIFCKNTYSPTTKTHNWDFAAEAEPKDVDVYLNCLSNHLSTYTRLGFQDQEFTTETREMLKQIHLKKAIVYVGKPLVNFTSYPCTDTPGRNKLLKKANLAQLPEDFGIMDYMSTQQDDYRDPCPVPYKPITMANPPYLQNRYVRTDITSKDGIPAKGEHQFFDNYPPCLKQMKALRMHRYLSFDPASGLQDFPKINLA